MSEMTRERVAAKGFDFSSLPKELEGKWVVIRTEGATQKVVESADRLRDAMRHVDPRDPDIVLTRVPAEVSVFVVHDE